MDKNQEKEFLMKNLDQLVENTGTTKEGVEAFIDDVETMGEHEDILQLAKEKFAHLLQEKVEEVEAVVETQNTKVKNVDGDVVDLLDRTAVVDNAIHATEEETQEKINELDSENLSQEANETKDAKKDFYSIEKPKTPEEIEKYRQTLQARFKELPEEYKSSVEDIMKVLDNPEALEIAAKSFGVDTKNYPDQNVRLQKAQELFKGMDEMPVQGNVYNPINKVFQSLSEKYPEKQSSLTKMQSLMKEHHDILVENNLYKTAEAVYNDPKKIENLFTYSKTGSTFDEPNMNLENGLSNASAGKKLVELGIITEEDLQNKLNNFLKQAEENDPYLVGMKKFPKEYEERVNRFKKEFGIVV